jgi:hypothetical protein
MPGSRNHGGCFKAITDFISHLYTSKEQKEVLNKYLTDGCFFKPKDIFTENGNIFSKFNLEKS